MTLHRLITRALAWMAASLLIPGAAFAQAQPQQPNIIWITAEDISPFIGAYGDREAKTPNIDQLAREGTRYTHAYTVSGVCAPSRSSFITGMYPTSIGTQHMRTGGSEFGKMPAKSEKLNEAGLPMYSAVLPPDVRPFTELLRKAGYYTSNNHKTDYQFETPVTAWDDNSPAASYRNRPVGKPFFSVFNFAITHESMLSLRRQDPLLADPATVPVPPIYPDNLVVRNDVARLYTNVERMDQQVGELIRMLKEDGVYDNSIIIFFSDHGGNLPWMKREVTERGTHIPFIVRFPGGAGGGTVSSDLVSGVDFAPTVLSLAGIPIPSYMQGQAFLGNQASKHPRRYVFAARDRMDEQYDRARMVRDKQYRYVYNYFPEKPYYQDLKFRVNAIPMMKEILALHARKELPPVTESWFGSKAVEELYDVDADPWELHNLVAEPKYQDKLAELRSAFKDWTSRYDGLGGLPEKEMLNRMWGGENHPPVTAKPEIVEVEGGVRLRCKTPDVVLGYWIERKGETSTAPHMVQSWDFAVFFGIRNGSPVPSRPIWSIYRGETVALRPDDILHVNANRIGYGSAFLEYSGIAQCPRCYR